MKCTCHVTNVWTKDSETDVIAYGMTFYGIKSPLHVLVFCLRDHDNEISLLLQVSISMSRSSKFKILQIKMKMATQFGVIIQLMISVILGF